METFCEININYILWKKVPLLQKLSFISDLSDYQTNRRVCQKIKAIAQLQQIEDRQDENFVASYISKSKDSDMPK